MATCQGDLNLAFGVPMFSPFGQMSASFASRRLGRETARKPSILRVLLLATPEGVFLFMLPDVGASLTELG